jgi:hypothetical protein
LILAAEDLAQPRLGVDPTSLAAWDALAVVRRDASADEYRELLQLDGGAGKWAALELVCRAPDDST